MKAFNLERALAGEKVITRDGREVSQLTHFDVITDRSLCGVLDNEMCTWLVDGVRRVGGSDRENYQLFMAPEKLSGFINYYLSGCPTHHNTLDGATQTSDRLWKKNGDTIARIDLSQFNEGEGL